MDLLIAKLEVAKRDIEAAARRRKQHRPNSSYDFQYPVQRSDDLVQRSNNHDVPKRRPTTAVRNTTTVSAKSNIDGESERKRGLHPKQLLSALKIGGPERSISIRKPADQWNDPRIDSRLPSLSRPRSSGNLVATELSRSKSNAKRVSKPVLDDYMYGTLERCQCQSQTQSHNNLDRVVEDAAKRRSKTEPILKVRPASSKQVSYTAYQRLDGLEPPSRGNTGYKSSYDLTDSSDADMGQRFRPKRASRSLMDLPALLKKDRTEVKEEEVYETDVDEKAARRRSHLRQKSAPSQLMKDSASRNDDRAKRRLTFMGFIKLFQHPTIG